MLKPFRHTLTAHCLATTKLGTALSLPAAVAAARELVIFRDVPSVDELNSVLFGAPEVGRSTEPKTRSIGFHEATPPAQPAPTPRSDP